MFIYEVLLISFFLLNMYNSQNSFKFCGVNIGVFTSIECPDNRLARYLKQCSVVAMDFEIGLNT